MWKDIVSASVGVEELDSVEDAPLHYGSLHSTVVRSTPLTFVALLYGSLHSTMVHSTPGEKDKYPHAF